MLRVLINRYHSKEGHALLKFLPEEERQSVMDQEVSSMDLTPILEQPQKALAKIHYSWIQPLEEAFPDSLRPALIAALTAQKLAGLKEPSALSISEVARKFILNQIYDSLKIDEHLPLEYLPQGELLPLAQWSRGDMIHLMDFLGLYDLASEVRQIVNRNYLKNIYACLTPKQFYYLKVCLHQKERLTSPKLGIDPTQQDCPKLKKIIHRRGLLRLGRALCGEHPDLVWHIAHTLDRGRGNVLLQEYHTEPLHKVTQLLKEQVLNLVNSLPLKGGA